MDQNIVLDRNKRREELFEKIEAILKENNEVMAKVIAPVSKEAADHG